MIEIPRRLVLTKYQFGPVNEDVFCLSEPGTFNLSPYFKGRIENGVVTGYDAFQIAESLLKAKATTDEFAWALYLGMMSDDGAILDSLVAFLYRGTLRIVDLRNEEGVIQNPDLQWIHNRDKVD